MSSSDIEVVFDSRTDSTTTVSSKVSRSAKDCPHPIVSSGVPLKTMDTCDDVDVDIFAASCRFLDGDGFVQSVVDEIDKDDDDDDDGDQEGSPVGPIQWDMVWSAVDDEQRVAENAKSASAAPATDRPQEKICPTVAPLRPDVRDVSTRHYYGNIRLGPQRATALLRSDSEGSDPDVVELPTGNVTGRPNDYDVVRVELRNERRSMFDLRMRAGLALLPERLRALTIKAHKTYNENVGPGQRPLSENSLVRRLAKADAETKPMIAALLGHLDAAMADDSLFHWLQLEVNTWGQAGYGIALLVQFLYHTKASYRCEGVLTLDDARPLLREFLMWSFNGYVTDRPRAAHLREGADLQVIAPRSGMIFATRIVDALRGLRLLPTETTISTVLGASGSSIIRQVKAAMSLNFRHTKWPLHDKDMDEICARLICDKGRYPLEAIHDVMFLQILVKKGLRPSSMHKTTRLSKYQTGILLRHVRFECDGKLGAGRGIVMTIQITFIKEKRYFGEGFLLRFIADDQPWDPVRLTIAYLYARGAFVSDDMGAMLASNGLRIRPELMDQSLFCLFDDFGNIMPDRPMHNTKSLWNKLAEMTGLPRHEIGCRSGRSGFGSGLLRHLMATEENVTRKRMLEYMTTWGCWASQGPASHYIDPNVYNNEYVKACKEAASMSMTPKQRIAYCDERFPFVMRWARRSNDKDDDKDDGVDGHDADKPGCSSSIGAGGTNGDGEGGSRKRSRPSLADDEDNDDDFVPIATKRARKDLPADAIMQRREQHVADLREVIAGDAQLKKVTDRLAAIRKEIASVRRCVGKRYQRNPNKEEWAADVKERNAVDEPRLANLFKERDELRTEKKESMKPMRRKQNIASAGACQRRKFVADREVDKARYAEFQANLRRSNPPPFPQRFGPNTILDLVATAEKLKRANGPFAHLFPYAYVGDPREISEDGVPCPAARCAQMFKTKQQLMDHMDRDHRDCSAFACRGCSKPPFPTLKDFKKHIVYHQFRYYCHDCGKPGHFQGSARNKCRELGHKRTDFYDLSDDYLIWTSFSCTQCEKERTQLAETVACLTLTADLNSFASASVVRASYRVKHDLTGAQTKDVSKKALFEHALTLCRGWLDTTTLPECVMAHLRLTLSPSVAGEVHDCIASGVDTLPGEVVDVSDDEDD